MPQTQLPTAHSFTLHTPTDVLEHTLDLLHAHLPYSLPLYRRLQFGHFTPTSQLITSLDAGTIRQRARTLHNRSDGRGDQAPWLISFSDPDRGPETQVFLFASWDVVTAGCSTDLDTQEAALLKAWVTHLARLGIYRPSRLTVEQEGRLRGWGGSHLALLGSVHERSAVALVRMGLLDPGFLEGAAGRFGADGVRMPVRYEKWVFRSGARGGQDGDGALETCERDAVLWRWAELRSSDYALVRSRTAIPRQDRTLAMLPSVAIFPPPGGGASEQERYGVVDGCNEHNAPEKGLGSRRDTGVPRIHDKDEVDDIEHDTAPIAWALLGVDASLTSLHVEPEYRGKGLARQLARRLLQARLGLYDERFGQAQVGGQTIVDWAHADVAEDNVSSKGVCRSLGGQVLWSVYWLRLDLSLLDGDTVPAREAPDLQHTAG